MVLDDLGGAYGGAEGVRTRRFMSQDGSGWSHHVQFIDVLHRSHAGVEDRVRTNKAMGLRNLP